MLVLDEAAFIKNIDELWTAAYPTLSTGGKAIALSTPNGQGNWFHKTFMDAENELNNFKPITLPWQLHPERDQKWYDDVFKGMNFDRRKMAQEHECDFIASGDTVIDPDVIKWYKKNMVRPPEKKFGVANAIWRWKDPIEGHRYLVVGDTARGDGKDYSAYEVIDLETMEQVEEFKYQIPTTDFADLLITAATTYNKALLAVENNGLGWSTVTGVIEKYGNIYYSDKMNMRVKNPFQYTPDHKKVPGFTNSTTIRPMVIDALIESVNTKGFKLYSKRLLDEITVFIWYRGKAQAMKGYNDDATISIAIGAYLRSDGLKESGSELMEIYTGEQRSYAEVFAPHVDVGPPSNPWQDPEFGDLSWLISG